MGCLIAAVVLVLPRTIMVVLWIFTDYLSTAFGTMEGTYEMVCLSGDRFNAKIAPFTLSEPYTVH